MTYITSGLPTSFSSLCWLLRGSPSNQSSLERFQQRRSLALVRHAYRNVPYYRRLFSQSGFDPDHFGLSDFQHLPLTRKEDIQAQAPEELVDIRSDPGKLRIHRTSGSTGTPLTLRTSWFEDRFLAARRLRPLVGWGWRAGEELTRIKIRSLENRPPELLRFLGRLGIGRMSTVDALAPVERIREELLRIKPRIILGYPALLSSLASILTDEDLDSLKLKFVVTGGSTTTDLMRMQIQEGFRTRVYELYGCHEANLVASQCPVSRLLHVADDSVIVEVLSKGKPVRVGETGEVVLTSLHSFSQPFIRYRLGDLARRGPAPCPCGAPFSTLERVEGRLQDWVRMPDGSTRSPDTLFAALLDHAHWILQFQLIQPDRDSLVLNIARRGSVKCDLDAIQRLLDSFAPCLSNRRVCLVREIPLSKNGKFHVSRSAVSPLYEDLQLDSK